MEIEPKDPRKAALEEAISPLMVIIKESHEIQKLFTFTGLGPYVILIRKQLKPDGPSGYFFFLRCSFHIER